jgi:hypothetical protein
MNNLKSVAAIALVGCGLTSCGNKPQARTIQVPANVPQAPLIQATAPQPPTVLTVPALPAPITQTVPVKGLITATNPKVQAAQISTAPKRDPFAALVPAPDSLRAVITKSPTVTKADRSAKPINPAQSASPAKPNHPVKASTESARLGPLAQRPGASLPQVVPPDLLPPQPLTGLPVLPLQPPPAPLSPASLAEAIEVTGVVQTTGKLMAIVRTPGDSDRYVQAGDYLAGGQVWLKQIVIGKGGEPRVILQQNGVEVIKSVGVSGPIARAL